MITKFEKLMLSLASLSRAEVAEVGHLLADMRAGGSTALAVLGFERVDVSPDDLMTEDGREISWSGGEAWALPQKAHAQRLDDAFERASQRDAAIAAQPTQPLTPPTTCLALIDGQLCGGTLINAPVCPRCALGKSGVAATRTCDVCGHVTAVMRGDS